MGEKQGTTEGMSSHQPQEMMDSIARFSLAKKDDISSGELHTEQGYCGLGLWWQMREGKRQGQSNDEQRVRLTATIRQKGTRGLGF